VALLQNPLQSKKRRAAWRPPIGTLTPRPAASQRARNGAPLAI
jgi:hypothetical protein